ncbi:NUDIX hydrolase [Saccharicrinis aurantiacus]|uniref:NUDIX hydrolase n=1 Tax=Saccharicrinis aurantiacus TaxID=1849719 RepID=UPI0008393198|nr:NUDIX domain-containing protein [Saccharicrinis aurantiacus]
MELNNYISVDCVIFGFDGERLKVLLVDRTLSEGSTSFTDLTLTGNHVYENEPLDAAADRVLFELTGLTNIYLEQFKTFAHPDRLTKENDIKWLQHDGRDPFQRIVSVGYFALLATDQVTLEWKGRNVQWVPVDEVGELAFDHNLILESALLSLRNKIIHEPIGFELLPQKFTLSQVQKVYEIILDTEFDKRNFRKKVARMKYLIPLDEKQKGVAHKPAQLYMFSRDVYGNTKKDLLNFIV